MDTCGFRRTNLQRKANPSKLQLKLLKLLNKTVGTPVSYLKTGEKVELVIRECSYQFPLEMVLELFKLGAIRRGIDGVEITQSGQRRLAALVDPCLQHVSESQQLTSTVFKENTALLKNTCESPLMRLYSRGQSVGGIKLTDEEFAAGERLRSDFERGQLQPRITANWEAKVGGRGRSVNEGADLSDFALDCRKRVERAISSLGPELSGVCLDVCCFLKGLQLVEQERHWPARSAKLMLKTGLGILARHYGLLTDDIPDEASSRILGWNTADYRPALKG